MQSAPVTHVAEAEVAPLLVAGLVSMVEGVLAVRGMAETKGKQMNHGSARSGQAWYGAGKDVFLLTRL